MAQKSLEGLLLYCDNNQIDILDIKFNSSKNGAIGIPQFMPMNMDYVLSSDHTIPDLNKMPDAILSAGNILKNKFNWPGLIDFNKFQDIQKIMEKYKKYDDENNNVSFCMSIDLDMYPLRRFTDYFSNIPNIDYIGNFAASLMNYNFSSYYSLEVLRLAFHAHHITQ